MSGADAAQLYAFGADGSLVANASLPIANPGAALGFHQVVRVTTATPQIASFTIGDVAGNHFGIDDVTYDDTHTVTVGVQGSGTVTELGLVVPASVPRRTRRAPRSF